MERCGIDKLNLNFIYYVVWKVVSSNSPCENCLHNKKRISYSHLLKLSYIDICNKIAKTNQKIFDNLKVFIKIKGLFELIIFVIKCLTKY